MGLIFIDLCKQQHLEEIEEAFGFATYQVLDRKLKNKFT